MYKENLGKKFYGLILTMAIFLIAFLPEFIKTEAADPYSAIHFINCGRGNATLVESRVGGKKVFGLIDSGSNGVYNSKVEPYLSSKLGGSKLKFIIVTHLDGDHAGNIIKIINKFVGLNDDAILYIKDTSTSSANPKLTLCNNIIAAAKTKNMLIAKIDPISKLPGNLTKSQTSINENVTSNMMKTQFRVFKRVNGGYKQTETRGETISFGYFTLRLFNGDNWNRLAGFSGWDENLNAVTVMLKYSGPSGGTFRTYLGSDLGENTGGGYSLAISQKAVEAMNTPVTIYQVAHHGYYNSLNKNIAKKLDFNYAIVTNSYNEIVKNALDKGKTLKEATSTLNALTGSAKFVNRPGKVFFTGGGTGSPSIYKLSGFNKKNTNPTGEGNELHSGNVVAVFSNGSMSIRQPA